MGEILARCGQQDVEKTCKWFLLWHNRSDIILSSSLWGKELQKRVMRPEIPRLERTFINLQLFPHNSLLPARRRISFQKGKKWILGRSTHGWTQVQQEIGGKWSFRIFSGQKLWWGESKASYSGRLFFIFAINQNCSHSNSEFLNLSG